jgi:hypothetical protein
MEWPTAKVSTASLLELVRHGYILPRKPARSDGARAAEGGGSKGVEICRAVERPGSTTLCPGHTLPPGGGDAGSPTVGTARSAGGRSRPECSRPLLSAHLRLAVKGPDHPIRSVLHARSAPPTRPTARVPVLTYSDAG